MSLHALLPTDVPMRALAWTLLLALWQTSLLALVVRGLFHRAARPKPQRRHAVAWGTLWIGVALAAASLWVLRHPVAARQAVQPLAAPVTTASRMLPSLPALGVRSAPGVQGQLLGQGGALHLLPWAGWLWSAVVVVLAGRVLGGWLLTRRVVRRAAPVTDPAALDAFASIRTRMGVRESVRLLESSDVDAPVTMCWPQPAILFPTGLIGELPAPAFEALAGHELGHVKRRDYVATLAQAVPDTLFFFSPGARWLSARVREAREQCCDDMAVAACGSAALYASALGAVAERGYCLGVGVLGATTPRLADRIRRLSEGDSVLRFNRVRWWALAAATLVFAVLAAGTGAVSLLDTAVAGAPPGRESGNTNAAIPLGFTHQQPGAPLTISATRSTTSYLYESVRVRNVAEMPIASVTLVAGVEGVNVDKPMVLVAGEPMKVALGSGESVELTANLLPPTQALALRDQLGTRKVQSMLGVLRVGFADGSEWRVLPRTGARRFDEAFYIPKGGVTALHVEKGESQGDNTGHRTCSDDLGLEYSGGGIVAVTDRPGALARCMHGRWVAYEIAR